MSALQSRLEVARRQNLRPPPKLNLVEWADERRHLSPEGAALPGRWKTSRVQVARGPMMAISDPRVHTVSIMCCTQLMKTEFILNIIGYHIDQDPAPMIVVQPSVHLGEAFSKDRVDPMLRDTPALAARVPSKRQRDSGNTVLHKQFPGGHLTIVGANAPGDLAMRPVRIVLCDEIDKYPASAGNEGDPILIIRERSATFWNYKYVSCCSPTIQGRSRIEIEYEAGDQRVFEPECPHCGHIEEMRWSNVKWSGKDPETALYHCPGQGCGVGWSDAERRRAVRLAGSRPEQVVDGCWSGYGWRATQPFNGHASFKVSKLASPWESDSLPRLVEKWLRAQQSPEMLKTFVNTQLAETWKEKGDAPEWQRLYDRREQYATNTLPDVPVMVFAGADVQPDRIEVEIVAYSKRCESWSVDYRVFPGATTDVTAADSPWRGLEALLAEHWSHSNGVQVGVRMLAVDAGYNTNAVLSWVRKWPQSRVVAVFGQGSLAIPVGQPKTSDVAINGTKKKRGARQWPIGTNILKTELYGWLKQERPTVESGLDYPYGYCHFPEYDEEAFRQLTAEEVVIRIVRGYRRPQWEKTRERNERLDCRNYARAASIICGLDRISEERWQEMAFEAGLLNSKTEELQPAPTPEAEPVRTQTVNGVTITRKTSEYWNRRR